jgi:hypothetical protein
VNPRLTKNTPESELFWVSVLRNKMKKIVRKENVEEKHNFFFNMWFCFIFPLTCRVKPLHDDDICESAKEELCEENYKKAERVWMKRFSEYTQKMKACKNNPEFIHFSLFFFKLLQYLF